MDKRKGFLNVTVSIFAHIILLIAAVFVRRLLIQYIGNDVNGLNSLFTSIIGMLGVAELGVGRAIVYSMYSPIVNGDEKMVAALFNLYKKLYKTIGSVILVCGLFIIPFLPKLISDYKVLNENVYITFLLTLISAVISYLYSAKTSLIEAHKDNYITTGIAMVSHLIRYGLQVAVIIVFRSFVAFLICQIIGSSLVWVLTEIFVQKKYPEVINTKETVDDRTKIDISKNVKAMVMHKTGTVMVQSMDSMIISSFIGVVVLGKYSNYCFVATTMVGILNLFFTPLTSVIGHLCAEDNKTKSKEYFDYFYSLNYFLGVVFFLGYYAVIDSVVDMLFGAGLEISRTIAFIITINQFIQYMRNAALLFRNASGSFYYDRWKPIAEGITNLVLSLLFVMVFPENMRVVGVIVATIITNLLICDTIEPLVVFHHVFGKSTKSFYFKNYSYISLFVVSLLVLSFMIRKSNSSNNEFVVNGFVSIIMSILLLSLIIIFDKSFRYSIIKIGKVSVSWLKGLTCGK